MRLTRRSSLALGLAAAAALGLPAAAAPGMPAADDMSLGSAKAPVSVVEYASLSCSHCAHFNETIFPALKSKYIDTGKVRYTLKEMLTPPQQVAAAGFLLARCAGPAKYFTVVDQVFRSQPRWRADTVRNELLAVAKANGLTEAQFESCITNEAAAKGLEARVQRASADGVNSTPTVFVNGKQVEIASAADLDRAIAAASPAARPKAGRR